MNRIITTMLCAVLSFQSSFIFAVAEEENSADGSEEMITETADAPQEGADEAQPEEVSEEETESDRLEEPEVELTDDTSAEMAAAAEGITNSEYEIVITEEDEQPGELENASYPILIPKDFVITAAAGSSVSIVYNIFHEFQNEKCVTEAYNSNDDLVGTAEKSFSNYYKGSTEYTINWDTAGLPAGRYTVKSQMMFYSMYDWHYAPSTSTVYVDLTEGAPAPTPDPNYYWLEQDGKLYWYEYGQKQGMAGDPKNIIDGQYHIERGREIYDPASDGWYWLDANNNGAKAVGKEVWMPYIYQDEDTWDDARKVSTAYESDSGMGECVLDAIRTKKGKWVRYDENGKMLKGWVTIEGELARLYPNQAGNRYYYDHRTGLMAKGWVTIDGARHYFDEETGVMQS